MGNCLRGLVCSQQELKMLAVGDELWKAVNVDNRAKLTKAETLLVIKVLDEEQRWSLPGGDFRATIQKFTDGIKAAAGADTAGGTGVTEKELKAALFGSMSDYSNRVAKAISKDVVEAYEQMKGNILSS